MKRKGWPIWLLRDVPAFLGIMLSFWPLVILLVTSGRRTARGKKLSWSVFETIALLLAHAEARLVFALTRQAYRRLGWNPRLVRFTLIPASETLSEAQERYANYTKAFGDMNAVVETYIADIRQRYNISERDAANARSCPLRHATASRATSPGFADGGKTHRSLSSLAARRGRWIAASSQRDGGGSRSSRGPPLHTRQCVPEPTTAPKHPLPGPHPHAQKKRPPSRTAFPRKSGSEEPRSYRSAAGPQAGRPSGPARV